MTRTTYSPDSGEQLIVKWGQFVLVGIVAAAMGMFFLSFQTWIDFGTVHMSGMDADALTAVSDGGVVAMLSSAIAVAAIGMLVRPRWTLALLPAIAVAAVAVFTIATYDILTGWHVGGADETGVFVASGDPTIALYGVAGLTLLVALFASALAAVRAGWVTHSKWLPMLCCSC